MLTTKVLIAALALTNTQAVLIQNKIAQNSGESSGSSSTSLSGLRGTTFAQIAEGENEAGSSSTSLSGLRGTTFAQIAEGESEAGSSSTSLSGLRGTII